MLREHRGDGHIAALVAADMDAPEALALRAGVDLAAGPRGHVSAGWSRVQMQPARGWTDEEWDAAVARLAAARPARAGWRRDAGGRCSCTANIEHATDVAAARPWAGLGEEQTE